MCTKLCKKIKDMIQCMSEKEFRWLIALDLQNCEWPQCCLGLFLGSSRKQSWSLFLKKTGLDANSLKTIGLYQTCHFFARCRRRLCCISFAANFLPTIFLRPSSLCTMHITVRRQLFWTWRTSFLVVLMKARFSFWPYSICQPHLIRWTTAFSLHTCVTCLAYLARLLNGFGCICWIDSSLSASTVGPLHKRSFFTGSSGFCLGTNTLYFVYTATVWHHFSRKVQSSQMCWRHSTSQIISSIWLSFTDSRHRAVCWFCWELDDWQ